jgi:hypothetical protein
MWALLQIKQELTGHLDIGVGDDFCGKFRTKVARYASMSFVASIKIIQHLF